MNSHRNAKHKGTEVERELVSLFWENGWSAVRVAGSGSMKFPSPDVLAGKPGGRIVVIECKLVNKSDKKYFTKKEIEELNHFAKIFNAEPWVYIKFGKEKLGFFITLEDLEEKNSSFLATLDLARNKGLLFEEFDK